MSKSLSRTKASFSGVLWQCIRTPGILWMIIILFSTKMSKKMCSKRRWFWLTWNMYHNGAYFVTFSFVIFKYQVLINGKPTLGCKQCAYLLLRLWGTVKFLASLFLASCYTGQFWLLLCFLFSWVMTSLHTGLILLTITDNTQITNTENHFRPVHQSCSFQQQCLWGLQSPGQGNFIRMFHFSFWGSFIVLGYGEL